MKKIVLLFTILLVFQTTFLQAQTFTFETEANLSDWIAGNGSSVSISDQHYKEGISSMCWSGGNNSILTVSFPTFTASTGNSAFLQIYSPVVTNDTLVVEFLFNSSVRRTANFVLNYKGWREFNRAYTEYASNVSFSVTSVCFTLKTTSNENRKIYFDDVRFNQPTSANRIAGTQWIMDKQYLNANTELLDLYVNTVDLPSTTPTAAELNSLNTLRTNLARNPIAGNTANLNAAKSFANELNIVRNGDGTVRGNVIDVSTNTLTNNIVSDYVFKLELLAADGLKNEESLVLFRNLLDHFIEQGFAEGVGFIIKTNDYTPARTIPAKLLNLLPACTVEQKDEVLKLVKWLSYYGKMYDPKNTYLEKLNSDVVYLFLRHIVTVATYQEDDAIAVRELKAFKRFLERNTEYVPGGGDILKPDGTGFHHGTQYNNYMYAYQTWMEHIYLLKNTAFKISLPAYERFKKAVISIYLMATLDTNNARHFANTLSGRNPFGSGIQVYFSRNFFENLIEVGGDILGTSIDDDLASYYNYFFKSTKYAVDSKNFDGFYQFNYGPIGIYRKDNWVATMHAPTTKLWGSEIYSGANRFGRYQSHGALEITYSGTTATTGYPSNTGGGWDWNVVPGTTTVHYASWQEMMPNKNTTDRFDQYTKTKNFSGALAWDNCGIYVTDFDQIDNWGGQRFTPTNLVFKKSMFAFDNIIISLGSEISSSGSYNVSMITATNLFQNILSSISGKLLLNGEEISRPNTVTLSTGQDNWIITPQGTGYFIPEGNDEVKLIHTTQKTPIQSGADYASPTTSAIVAKAYINHGVKPTNKKYSFVVVPATNSNEMQTIASQMANNGGSIFEIHAQNEKVHALTYKPTGTTAYAFFDAVSNLTFGIVKSTTYQHLLLHRAEESTGRQFFAVSNPNLNPVNDSKFGWKSQPTQTTITFNGEWLPLGEAEGVQFHAPSNGTTQVTVTFEDGKSIFFALKTLTDTKIENNDNSRVEYSKINGFLQIKSPLIDLNSIVSLYSLEGKLLQNTIATEKAGVLNIPISTVEKGVYVCKVQNSKGKSATFKWIQ